MKTIWENLNGVWLSVHNRLASSQNLFERDAHLEDTLLEEALHYVMVKRLRQREVVGFPVPASDLEHRLCFCGSDRRWEHDGQRPSIVKDGEACLLCALGRDAA